MTFAILISLTTAEAQTPLSYNLINSSQRNLFVNNVFSPDTVANKKWFLSTYTGISTGFNFFNSTSSTFIAAPIGVQLNRMLNKNLYAFAGVSVAPVYVNFNQSFLLTDVNKMYPGNSFYNSNSFGIYSGAELGLMYVNDAKTFSVSGSINVQRSSYPFLPYQSFNTAKKNSYILTNR